MTIPVAGSMAVRVFQRTKIQNHFTSLQMLTRRFSTYPGKAPTQLTSISPERNLIPLAGVFRRYGFSPSGINDFLCKNRFLLNVEPSNVEKSFKIILSIKPSQEFLASVVHSCPSVLEFDFLRKWERGLSEIGVEVSTMSSVAIQNVLEVSRRFELGPDDFSSCIMCLKGLDFSERTVVKVLEAFPMVIMMSKDDIFDKLAFLVRNIGIEKEDLDRIFKLFPNLLAFKVGSRLNPLLDEFKDLGFGLDAVRREVVREPRVLGLEVGELSQCLKMLRCLKCRAFIKDSIFSYGEFRAGYDVKLRVDFLRKFGLTYRDAFTVLWREPRAILFDIVDLEKKIEFLISTMKFDILSLVEVPNYLGVSFEKKIVPRYNVIEFLRSRGWLGDEVALRGLIKPSRLRFYNLYVKPYPECEEIYGRYARKDNGFRRGHPVGMWKLFAPQKHSQSQQDVKNIKAFMESTS